MAKYDFTVRAMDNLGAFADRDFSIEVKNTSATRFVVVGNGGIAHSIDGITWTKANASPPPIQSSGVGVSYGDGKWVVYGNFSIGSTWRCQYHVSYDGGVTWRTIAKPASTGEYTFIPNGSASATHECMAGIRFLNGKWHAWVGYNNTTPHGVAGWYELVADDIAGPWTKAALYHTGYTTSFQSSGPNDVVYLPSLDRYVALGGSASAAGNERTWYRNGDQTTWTETTNPFVAYTTSDTSNMIEVGGTLFTTITNSTDIGMSADGGLTWAKFPIANAVVTSASTSGICYVNGRLVVARCSNTTNLSRAYGSVDGGRTWEFLSEPTSNLGTLTATKDTMKSHNGTIVRYSSGTTNNMTYSTDGGVTWATTFTPFEDIGAIYTLGVR